MPNPRDRVSVLTATTGTGTITCGAAVAAARTFASAYASAMPVSYTIDDGNAWETGIGVYDPSANTLTRTMDASSTGALLNLSGSARVSVTALSRDLRPVYVTQKRTAGDVSIPFGNASTLYDFNTTTDITIPAVAGDLIELCINCQLGDSKVNTVEWNVATIVSNTTVNLYAAGTIAAWTMRQSDYFGLSANVKYIVQANDISAGTVTFRLKVRTDGGNSSVSRTIFANANQPFVWDARNFGIPVS